MLTDKQFARSRELALTLAGIELFERHREVLARRSRRAGLPEAGLDQLLAGAAQGEPDACQKFVGLVTTKFTGFFRHPLHFQRAAAHALQAAKRRGRTWLWSAGTATGEEAYSLAITLLEAAGPDGLPTEILATDVDVEALATGRKGEYGALAVPGLSFDRRARFFTETVPGRRWLANRELRQRVHFQALNLVSADWPTPGPFDVILCRNVLMYLEPQQRVRILARLAASLAADGLLILDPAEYVGADQPWFRPESEGIYSRRMPGSPAPLQTRCSA